ncbi:MAG: phosphoribosylanthranilate isomerase [Desulfonauticus sp.]|nr:phosphoribosylanthranilate isomerase [Desulfonauticus sp.]
MLVKVCGLTQKQDVLAIDSLGVDMLGFIFYPKSPRYVKDRNLLQVKTRAKKVGVVVDYKVSDLEQLMQEYNLDLIQLHGEYEPTVCKSLGKEKVIKVFWPARYEKASLLAKELEEFLPYVSYFLFDAGLKLGGHGKRIEPGEWKALVKDFPIILAGGIAPDNVKLFVSLNPLGLDVNSGVEVAPGLKDLAKVEQLLKIAKNYNEVE